MPSNKKNSGRAAFSCLWLLLLLCAWALAGCDKPPADSPKIGADQAAAPNPAAHSLAATAGAGPKDGEKTCFACKGEGTIKCLICVGGQVDCPGTCLRLNRGVWVHMEVPGHPATDVWQKFYQPDGSYTAYTQGHVGHIIAMQGGKAVDTGPCPICGGSTKVACKACQGTGKQPCPICEGKKFVPLDWSPTNNPWLNRQPDLIRLADGRVLFGKVVSAIGTNVTIKTRDGKWLHLSNQDMLPNPTGVSTNNNAK
jgi:hypothetical protein